MLTKTMKRIAGAVALLGIAALSEGSRTGDARSYRSDGEAQMGTLYLVGERDVQGSRIPAPAVGTEVRIQVTGLIGRTRVVQTFRNPSDEWAEGVYVFPLPERAAVDTLRMVIGERVIEGQIQERGEARKTYEAAKRAGKKASLLEQERPNLFTTSVAQIGPQEEVRIELEYQEDIRYDSGRFDLRFPMVVGPRYIPGTPVTESVSFSGNGWGHATDVVPDAGRITPPVSKPGDPRENPVDLEVELDLGMALPRIESTSHEIRVEHQSAFRYRVSMVDGIVPADRDFTLSWKPDVSEAPRAALFTERIDSDEYFLLMVLPPDPERSSGVRLARETVFVIDTSGSMNGVSIVQARAALSTALDRLQPNDVFNVIEFNAKTSELFGQPVPGTQSAISRAKRYVNGLDANGGTEMLEALAEAFHQNAADEIPRVRQVIFITDGSVGNEAQLFSYIQEHLDDRRLFTVGNRLGAELTLHDPRRTIWTGGPSRTLGLDGEVSRKMDELFGKLESPVLSHIELGFEDANVEAWPTRVPDLYVGEPVVVVAKLPHAPGRASGIDVRGRRGEEPWGVGFQLRAGRTENGISKLWARRKIAALMDSMADGADRDEVRTAVVDVALQHHLVSRFTSLVAVDVTPTSPTANPVTKAVPTELPAGWTHEQAVGTLPQGGTAAQLLAMLGFLLLIAGLLLRWSSDTSCKDERSVYRS